MAGDVLAFPGEPEELTFCRHCGKPKARPDEDLERFVYCYDPCLELPRIRELTVRQEITELKRQVAQLREEVRKLGGSTSTPTTTRRRSE